MLVYSVYNIYNTWILCMHKHRNYLNTLALLHNKHQSTLCRILNPIMQCKIGIQYTMHTAQYLVSSKLVFHSKQPLCHMLTLVLKIHLQSGAALVVEQFINCCCGGRIQRGVACSSWSGRPGRVQYWREIEQQCTASHTCQTAGLQTHSWRLQFRLLLRRTTQIHIYLQYLILSCLKH